LARFFSFFSRNSPGQSPPRANQEVILPDVIGEQGVSLINNIGYGMILFSAMDYLMILLPPQFTNPIWEFQTIKRLIEQAGVPLIGFAFVFYRPLASIRPRSLYLLRFLSWLCLIIGITYLLMVPLAIVNTGRISLIGQNETNSQVKARTTQIEEIEKALERGLKPKELSVLAQGIGLSKEKIASTNLKEGISEELLKIKTANKAQALQVQNNLRDRNLRDLIKIIFEAALLCILFVWTWTATAWTRLIRAN
jgi:hypothetical protein